MAKFSKILIGDSIFGNLENYQLKNLKSKMKKRPWINMVQVTQEHLLEIF